MSHEYGFNTPKGEAAYVSAYNAAMKLWSIPYQEAEIPTRFGRTHVIVSGPTNAPPLALLHGYMATSVMWAPNIQDLSREHRVYAIDVMGQPSKSIPDVPIRDAADYVSWLSETLDVLKLERISLVGMSYGGWLALTYAVAAPERVQKLVLLSPGGLLPMSKQFIVRGMLMVSFPTRFTVNSFMGWLGIKDTPGDAGARPVLELTYLGLKHFRMAQETLRVLPAVFSDEELRQMHVPMLLLIGANEVICDPVRALERARRQIPHFQGELVPRCRHDMVFSQHGIVDARILDFLRKTTVDGQDHTSERFVA